MLLSKHVVLLSIIIALSSCNNATKNGEPLIPTNFSNTSKPFESEVTGKPAAKKAQGKRVVSTGRNKKTSKAIASKIIAQNLTSLTEDFETIEQEFQEFTIDPSMDTTLTCKEGTTLKLMPSSFLIESTQAEATEKITFKIKEFYKTSDILLARLSTHSDSSILETGGMLFIQALSNGQLCRLKDSASIEISFPYTQQKDSMLLFSGEWKNKMINWKRVAQQKLNHLDTVYEPAVFPGGSMVLRNFLERNVSYPDLPFETIMGGKVEVHFIVDEDGKVKDVCLKDTTYERFKATILYAFSKMPRWKPAKKNGVPVASKYTQVITFGGEEYLPDTAYKSYLEATTDTSKLHKLSTGQITRYIFSTATLGWINCDRFYKSKKARTDFYIDCGDFTGLDVKLVFHTFKSILADYTLSKICTFKNIPVDEPVTIVVIKKLNNATFISLTECNTNVTSIKNLTFKEATMDKLKQVFERLNDLGN